uniref:C2H2-type domain-containing protein n=1 Tax=Cacopsylla melanoneura TaxID=428564 RepID=A0A8D8LU51_9HEMI
MIELTTRLLSATFVIFCIQVSQSEAASTRKHEKATLHDHKHKEPNKKHGNAEHGHHADPSKHHSTHTTTNRVQYKIRNRWRKANMTTKGFWHSNESIELDSYSFEPLEWSDNRLPPTLRPAEEHVQMWKDIMKDITYPDKSDPDGTLDPNLSHKRYFQCAFCFGKFDDDEKLKYHYELRHPEEWGVTTTTEPSYICAHCHPVIKKYKQSEFRHHQETAHNLSMDKYNWEHKEPDNYEPFDTKEAMTIFDKRFGGSDEYQYYTYPKNQTFFMTMYDIPDDYNGSITHHYVDPWPNEAND